MKKNFQYTNITEVKIFWIRMNWLNAQTLSWDYFYDLRYDNKSYVKAMPLQTFSTKIKFFSRQKFWFTKHVVVVNMHKNFLRLEYVLINF